MKPTGILQLIASKYLRGSSHQFFFDVRWSQQQKSGRRGGMDGSDKSADFQQQDAAAVGCDATP
jgi:hypothetical protein